MGEMHHLQGKDGRLLRETGVGGGKEAWPPSLQREQCSGDPVLPAFQPLGL